MASLYEIAGELRMALAAADQGDGELAPSLTESLDGLTLSLEAKVENVCKARQEYLANALAVKLEVDRLATLQRRLEAKADWLKGYLQRCLELAGADHIETALFRVRLQANSAPSVMVPDGEVPTGWGRLKTEWNKEAIVAAWRNKSPLPEGVSVVVKKHLRIT